ncbi:serine/threonine protein kinase [Fonticula alba]|uniref:Serine/threonine protein kinase n=1 Tax=Fonticula alba TaxID=691883 RepID=A0A058Z0W4_FONAL|nr:serine/threonine protein kinase [Fonticula alba]KCV67548.1 serine/threonine protein kinase [Fonticula alba]|eukprot:XP_009498109.1 serine/threonine protein kinase [Fonticula alba]
MLRHRVQQDGSVPVDEPPGARAIRANEATHNQVQPLLQVDNLPAERGHDGQERQPRPGRASPLPPQHPPCPGSGTYLVEGDVAGSACVAACSAGYFQSGTRCLACGTACATCSGSATTCTSCPSGRYLQGTTCVAACAWNHFQADAPCLPCDAACARCAGSATTCTACPAGQLLQVDQCLAACSAGYFAYGANCLPCSAACATCSGSAGDHLRGRLRVEPLPGRRHLPAVRRGVRPLLQVDQCLAACSAGYFAYGANCLPCSAACATCSGSAGACTGCHPGSVLENGACLDACSPGLHPDPAGRCACHATCQWCSPEGQPPAYTCHACPPGMVRAADGAQPDRCFDCHASCAACALPAAEAACTACPPGAFLHEGRCLAACPAGTWPNAQAVCLPCPAACSTCTGPGLCTGCQDGFFLRAGACEPCSRSCATCTGPDSCTACQPGLIFRQPSPQAASLCGIACDEGHFPQPERCGVCHASCQECHGQPDACQRCAAGFRWAAGPPADPASGARCVACPAGCASCTRDHACLGCFDPLVLTPEGACVDTCPAGTWTHDASCRPCNMACLTCTGPAASQCASCAPGLELIREGAAAGTCASGCQERQYRDPASGECRPCHPACATCNGPSDRDCWRCNDALLQDRQCVQACLSKHYPLEGRCLPCDPMCGECKGHGRLDCTECAAGLFHHRAESSPLRCLDQCPPGHRAQQGTCRSCPPRCRDCWHSADTCDRCSSAAMLHQGACVSACPAGTLSLDGTCFSCDASCTACHGPGPEHCDSCADAAPFLLDGVCHRACPAATYPDARQCIPCHRTCAECTGPWANACTACPADRVLGLDGSCLTRCPGGQHPEPGPAGGSACRACSPACRLCDGPTAGHCTACADGRLLEDGHCVDACSGGAFLCPPTEQCLPCPSDCAACTRADTYDMACVGRCTACAAGMLLSPSAGRCLEACPPGEVLRPGTDTEPARCQPCAPACGTCHRRPDWCTACAGSGRWLLSTAGQCVPECPAAGFAASPAEPVCLPCVAGCRACQPAGRLPVCAMQPDGSLDCPRVATCQLCEPGLLLLQGASCVSDCPAGHFADWDGSPPACAACSPGCWACTGPEKTDCLRRVSSAASRRIAFGLGIGLGLLLLLLLLLLVAWLVRRLRQAAKPPAGAGDPDHDSTVLNTILELSLPGAIQVSLAADFLALDGAALGAGTQASVFAARAIGAGVSTRLGCPDIVAIKQLKGNKLTPLQVTLLQNEIALMWLLRDCAHIVRIYGYSDQPPAIVMECFQSDLATLLRSDIALPLSTLLSLAQQWTSGLEAMHDRGIAHCDLKPANVLVSPAHGQSWQVALGDLGTARNLSAARASALVNEAPVLNALTARYAAPEVLAAFHRARPLDMDLYLPADVYAAAMMLWETLTRVAPWQGLSFQDITARVHAGQRPDLALATAAIAQANPGLGQNTADILQRMWAADAHARPSAAGVRQVVATLAVMLPGQ